MNVISPAQLLDTCEKQLSKATAIFLHIWWVTNGGSS